MNRFQSSAQKMKNIKFMAICAMFIALKVVLSYIRIPVGENLNIFFTFVATAVEASILGPTMATVSGFITDIVGYMIHPTGPFFPGYTLNTMLGSLIYALFLYERKITVVRLFGAKFIVNYFVNVLLGSYYSSILYSKGYIFYLTKSLVKNTILLPIEVILLVAVFNLILPILWQRKLVKKQDIPLKIK